MDMFNAMITLMRILKCARHALTYWDILTGIPSMEQVFQTVPRGNAYNVTPFALYAQFLAIPLVRQKIY